MPTSRPDRAPTSAPRLGRRGFLVGAGALAGLTLVGGRPSPVAAWPRSAAYPFSLGVASGDPLPDGVVLWTRLAPDPLSGGGMPREPVDVEWTIWTDDNGPRAVQYGLTTALPELAHSVHVDVRGLEPGRWYWYRFRVGDEESPIGRTRTAPAPGAEVERLRFAFASCQNWEHGYYTAYRHMAAEELDLVVHLGDYIYEGPAQPNRPRQHDGPETTTLEQYRGRHALYKTDPDLQAAHAAFPWVVTWDDHEVANNYAGAVAGDRISREAFLARRAAAYRAYWEHLPLRPSSMPAGAQLPLYRRLGWGNLAELSVLDTRQYRTDQPCGDGLQPLCAEALDAAATMAGPEQERWLLEGLDASPARWNVIAQQVMMARLDLKPGPEQQFIMDHWSGYPAARDRILNFLALRRPSNPVVITGDIHSSWVADLKADWDDPGSATVGTELVGTSISSGGDGADSRPEVDAALPENPHFKFYNGRRGYVRCELTSARWQADFRVLPSVTAPGAPIATVASFVVEDGRPGALPA